MIDKLTMYLIERVFVKGWRGSFTVHVDDGVPMKIDVNRRQRVEEL